jgi:hypothetical protein
MPIPRGARDCISWKLLAFYSTKEVVAALRARALLWVYVFQPLRVASLSTTLNKSFLQMNQYAEDLHNLCNTTCHRPNFASVLRSGNFNPFTDPAILASGEVKRYREYHRPEIDAATTSLSRPKGNTKTLTQIPGPHAKHSW